MARIIVFGNEKGGAGKSTLAIHVAVGLLLSQQRVGVIDLDLRQQTLLRFFENRDETRKALDANLPIPHLVPFTQQIKNTPVDRYTEVFLKCLQQLSKTVDFIIVDCPGALTPLSVVAHQSADCLVTPMNDSFIDFDLLAKIGHDSKTIKKISFYAEMVWKARQGRAALNKPAMDWIVLRNRLPSQEMHNKRNVGAALTQLAKRIGFRLLSGLSDRVIYKELFPRGLTIADCQKITKIKQSLSNVAARQELRDVLNGLQADLKIGF